MLKSYRSRVQIVPCLNRAVPYHTVSEPFTVPYRHSGKPETVPCRAVPRHTVPFCELSRNVAHRTGSDSLNHGDGGHGAAMASARVLQRHRRDGAGPNP